MTSRINEKCTLCTACQKACPTGAISPGARFFVVDADVCTDCLLCVPVCPVEAVENPLVPPKARKKRRQTA